MNTFNLITRWPLTRSTIRLCCELNNHHKDIIDRITKIESHGMCDEIHFNNGISVVVCLGTSLTINQSFMAIFQWDCITAEYYDKIDLISQGVLCNVPVTEVMKYIDLIANVSVKI